MKHKKNSSPLTKGRTNPIMILNLIDNWFSCGVRKPEERKTNQIQLLKYKYNNLNITENIRGGNYGI